MRDFFRSIWFKIVAIVLAFLLGFMLYSATAGNYANPPAALLQVITAPVQKATAWMSRGVSHMFQVLLDSEKQMKENELLKEELYRLQNQLIDYEEIKSQKAQLEELVGLTEINQEWSLSYANIVGSDPNDQFSSFTVDKGSLHGVSKGDPVITGAGLVGILEDVGPVSSKVITILDPNLAVACYDSATNEIGTVQGQSEYADTYLTKLLYLSRTTKVAPGNTIATSGSGGVFPKGIAIGSVEEIKSEPNGIGYYGVIRPAADLKNLKNVIILTDFLGKNAVQPEGQGEQP